MAYDEGEYEEAVYYAKMALLSYRPCQHDYADAFNDFHEIYSTIKLDGWESGADIVEIYENSIRKLSEVNVNIKLKKIYQFIITTFFNLPLYF